MTLIVFSDIHGNIYSLEKAFKEMEKVNPDQYLFLGDMAGYYYYQNECIELLNSLNNLISIKGNHDDNFLKALHDENLLNMLDNKYGKAYSLFRNNIKDSSLKYLQSMNDFEKNSIFEAYHGSPANYYNEYIYPNNKDFQLGNVNTPFLFMGHTHYVMEKKIQDTIVINPGSIGQPRDFNKPSFAVVDTNSINVELVRYDYKKEKLKQDIARLNDNNYLLEILNRT